MAGWERDWRDDKVDRLEKRVRAIEEAMWKAKQRSFERTFYALLAIIWLLIIGSAVLSIVEKGSG